jgi:hypothetical protein
MNTIIDLSLKNAELYKGCQIEIIAGRENLSTPLPEAVEIVGKNIRDIVAQLTPEQRNGSVILTGPMAVWSYLIVFHAVVHCVREVIYSDGRNPPVAVAKHG